MRVGDRVRVGQRVGVVAAIAGSVVAVRMEDGRYELVKCE